MRKNIVISATRQWNPGDEFIMLGVLNILDELGLEYNPILFNRSPEVRDGRKYNEFYKNKKQAKTIEDLHLLRLFKGGFRDNSYKNGTDPIIVDAVIFAGSPEWYGYRVKVLYELLNSRNIPYMFLGIGMGDSRNFRRLERINYNVLKNCPLITVRDHRAYEMLKVLNNNVYYLTCPAMLAAKKHKEVQKVNKIALIYSTNKTLFGNNVSVSTHDYLVNLYRKLISDDKYEYSLVCHYIDEIEEAKKEFPEMNIFYSFDAKDYIDLYDHFDFVVGGRVHGIGMCASLGIPGVMISHDIRSETVAGFHATIETQDAGIDHSISVIYGAIQNANKKSKEIIELKKYVMNEYTNFIKERRLLDF